MGEITDEILRQAWRKDNNMAGRVDTLRKFHVVGTLKTEEARQLSQFLTDQGVDYETNGQHLVWLPRLPAALKDTFKRSATVDKTPTV